MDNIELKEVLNKAKEWQESEKSWHFHLLMPDCLFNESNDEHALVLENNTDEQQYVVYTEKRQMKLGEKLVKMLHGEKVLKGTKKNVKPKNEQLNTLVKRSEEMNKHDIPWHHHVFFPDCKYNDRIGLWNIVMEDKDKGQLLEATYETEPIEDLKIIEKLFFLQKE